MCFKGLLERMLGSSAKNNFSLSIVHFALKALSSCSYIYVGTKRIFGTEWNAMM
jgi:hypothetical protein